MTSLLLVIILSIVVFLIACMNPWRWQAATTSRIARLALVLFLGSSFVFASNQRVGAQSDPLLEITKDFGGSTALDVESGEEFTYYIAYRCASITQDCVNTAITDVLPPEVIFIDGTGPVGDITKIHNDECGGKRPFLIPHRHHIPNVRAKLQPPLDKLR